MIDLLTVLCGAVFGIGALLGILAFTPPPVRRETATSQRRGRVVGWIGRWWRRALLAAVATGVVSWATGWPVAGAAAAAAVIGLPVVLASRQARQTIQLQDALAVWTRRVGDLLASGAGGLHHAVTQSAGTAPEPLTAPVRRLAERLHTESPETALRAFATELDDPTADEVVLALLLRLRTGGRGLVEILHGQAAALRARAAATREVEADRAKPRTTVRTLVAITTTMIVGLLVFAHDYLAPFNSWTGQVVLVVAAGIFAVSLWRMHRLATLPERPRYLTEGPSS
ncbi:pilus assembly protein TadB [Saccharopolyspora hirsuta]|uniref:Pilus assembly protein TadB n=1 Tax=Saccharopolyspora hirsuta TaxID=1837 RepID=A0A5M7B7B0_SACHI|nr:pilus assembly protein TadB [Saccharopolyspora hirsuta]KAA5825443.1 pilus assembly protein TadB [Saccharopolyspora hirsuta]